MNAPKRHKRGEDIRSVQGNLAVGNPSVTQYKGGKMMKPTDQWGEPAKAKWGSNKSPKRTWGN